MGQEAQELITTLDSGNGPDLTTIDAKALRIQQLASMIPDLFAIDTHTFPADTTALAKIWTEESKFDDLANKLVTAMGQLIRVSQTPASSTDERTALRMTAAQALGVCGECHSVYRARSGNGP